MPDKTHHQKLPPSQKKLQSEDSGDLVDRLVSLTFDSDPNVRRKIAHELSKIGDDPRALLALIELSSDKDESISSIARTSLGSYRKEDEEAFSSLEKMFENARKEGKDLADDESTQAKLMPSLEKLFAKHKGSRDKLMPSLMKMFSHQHFQSTLTQAQQAEKLSAGAEKENEIDEEIAPQSPPQQDSISNVEYSRHSKSVLDEAEELVGVPPKLQPMEQIKSKFLPEHKKPSDGELEMAANFPLPQNISDKMHSPMASLPSVGEGSQAEIEKEEEKLPVSRLDYYKWAYALAISPSAKASDLKKEKDRLIKEAKNNIELAFKLALSRAREDGIEGLSGLKPGMKKLSTLPLEVTDHHLSMIPAGKKKMEQMSRLLLSDGKTSIPFYVSPARAEGIKAGDLVSLRDAYVDFFVYNKEKVLLLGKNGQIIITK